MLCKSTEHRKVYRAHVQWVGSLVWKKNTNVLRKKPVQVLACSSMCLMEWLLVGTFVAVDHWFGRWWPVIALFSKNSWAKTAKTR